MSRGVTVVVPTLNEESNLSRYLRNMRSRVRELPGSADVEVLVVDSNSDDATLDSARSSPVVDRVVTEDRKGVMFARECGVREAKHDLTVHTDADTVYPTGWLPSLLSPFADHGDQVMTYGSVQGKMAEFVSRSLYANGLRDLAGQYAPGQNRAFRRPAYYRVGGYDFGIDQSSGPRTSMEEEVRFPQRMSRVGRVEYVPGATCYTSDRNITSLIVPTRSKEGGAQWNEVA